MFSSLCATRFRSRWFMVLASIMIGVVTLVLNPENPNPKRPPKQAQNRPIPPRPINSSSDLLWGWAFPDWQVSTVGNLYPKDGAIGGPNESYILEKCRVAEELLIMIKPQLQALSCTPRPNFKLLIKGDEALQWAEKTASLHREIFKALAPHPDITELEVMLGDHWKSRIRYTESRNFGCSVAYMNQPTRILGIYSSLPVEWGYAMLDPHHRGRYGLSLQSINGSEGGTMSLMIRLNLRDEDKDFSNTLGVTKITFRFNPFAKGPARRWDRRFKVKLRYSKEFQEVHVVQ